MLQFDSKIPKNGQNWVQNGQKSPKIVKNDQNSFFNRQLLFTIINGRLPLPKTLSAKPTFEKLCPHEASNLRKRPFRKILEKI